MLQYFALMQAYRTRIQTFLEKGRDSRITILFGTVNDRLACADAGCTTPAANMNERLKLGSDEDGANDQMWVVSPATELSASSQAQRSLVHTATTW